MECGLYIYYFKKRESERKMHFILLHDVIHVPVGDRVPTHWDGR
jgi:hypothetical protein